MTDYYRAVDFAGTPPTDHIDIRGKDLYYQVSFGHRMAFVSAADVDIVRPAERVHHGAPHSRSRPSRRTRLSLRYSQRARSGGRRRREPGEVLAATTASTTTTARADSAPGTSWGQRTAQSPSGAGEGPRPGQRGPRPPARVRLLGVAVDAVRA